jgi:NAD(P)H-flavin reductase
MKTVSVVKEVEEIQTDIKVRVESMERFQEDNFFMKVKPDRKLNFKAGQFVMIKHQGIFFPICWF